MYMHSRFKRYHGGLCVVACAFLFVVSLVCLPRFARADDRVDINVSDYSGTSMYGEEGDLRQAIDAAVAANKPARIHLTASQILLTKKLTIPAGADIELVNYVDDGSNPNFILAPKSALTREDGFRGAMIVVNKGAKLTLTTLEDDGELAIEGRGQWVPNGDQLLQVEGELVINRAVIRDAAGVSGFFYGAVTVSGKDASLTMYDGLITNNKRTPSPTTTQKGAGNVAVNDGATFTMNGGTISNGTGSEVSGGAYGEAGGVGVYNGAHFIMNGGNISNNGGFGGGIVAWTWMYGTDMKKWNAAGTLEAKSQELRSTVEIHGGSINNNMSGFGGGGVLIFGNAKVLMDGGEIVDNTAPSGGGVNAMNLYTWGSGDNPTQEVDGMGKDSGLSSEEYGKYQPGAFVMTGGTIARNTAQSTGGGVNVVSNAVVLSGGDISNNTAGGQGGGVYVATKSYTAHFFDAAIYDNEASSAGGGIWTCPTGSLKLYVTRGALVAGNSVADRKNCLGDDIAHTNYGANGAQSAYLADHVLGGGSVQYFWDNMDARFDAANPGEPVHLKGGTHDVLQNQGLHSVVAADDSQLARDMAQLHIHNNAAPLGGGVGTNGGVTFGEPSDIELKVDKQWVDALTGQKLDGQTIKDDAIHAILELTWNNKAYQLREFTLEKANNWTIKLEEIPAHGPDGNPLEYKIWEVDADGNKIGNPAEMDVSAAPADQPQSVHALLTNKVVKLKLDKVWINAKTGHELAPADIPSESVQIAVCRSDSQGNSELLSIEKLSKKGNWTASPALETEELRALDASGQPYTYWAYELDSQKMKPEDFVAQDVSEEDRNIFEANEDNTVLEAKVINKVEPPTEPPAPPTEPPAPPTEPPAPPAPPRKPLKRKVVLPQTSDSSLNVAAASGVVVLGVMMLAIAFGTRSKNRS